MNGHPAPKGGSRADALATCAATMQALGLTLHDLAEHLATQPAAAAPAPQWAAAAPAKPERKRHVPVPADKQKPRVTGQAKPTAAKLKPPAGDVVGMDTAPRTFTPAPADNRFTVAPGEKLTGGFGRWAPGIDPMTGEPWEKRA